MAAKHVILLLVACLLVTSFSGCVGSSSSYSSSSTSSSSAPSVSSSSSSSEAVVSSSSSSSSVAAVSSSSSSSVAAAVSSSSSSSSAAAAVSSSSSSSAAAAVSSSSSSSAVVAAGTTTPTPTPTKTAVADTPPVILVPITPTVPAFTLPTTIVGGQVLEINMGTVPSPTTTNGKLILVVPNANVDSGEVKEIALFGPALYPTAPVTVTMPVLLEKQEGVFMKIVTFTPEGAVLFNNCDSCKSLTFTLDLGGSAANPQAVEEAQQPIVGREENSTPPNEALFIIRSRASANKPLEPAEVDNLLNSVDVTDIKPDEAFNLLTSIVAILPDTTNAAGSEPSAAVAAKVESLMQAVLGNDKDVATVFVRDEAESLMDSVARFLKQFGLNANSKKFNTQLTAAEEAANVIPKLLEMLRQVAAKTVAAAGTIDRSNVCSHVVTNANGGTFCNGASQFPHVIELIGNNLPSDSSRRVTAISMDLAAMDRSDQTLTNTLDLRTGVSPHFATIIAPLVSDPSAHQLRSTFDQAKNNNAAAADNTFNCYQRIATNNADPSGNYVQIAAANQDRPSATTIRCIGANSGLPRWVTLAKPFAQAGANNGANNGPTGSSTITAPVTPTAPTARTVAADSDDGSSASGIIGGVFGGVGFLLIIFALIALVLLKAKKTSSDTQALTSEEVYWQDNGAYKVPAPTPV